MKICTRFSQTLLLALIIISPLVPRISQATIVEFQTVMGNFQVNLYDNATPQTVANFLSYVNNGAYTSSVIHRSVPGFIVQGGGFAYSLSFPPQGIATNPAVTNEPEFSNVRGTIAMAKLGGNPNSATNQWFFNLANNAANLDGQNGGFTAFGQVIGSGMDVLDAIAALSRFDLGAPFGELPLRNYTGNDLSLGVPITDLHLIIITGIVVTDTTVDTAAGLNPPVSTAPPPAPTPPPVSGGGGGGGGGFGLLPLLALLLVSRRRLF